MPFHANLFGKILMRLDDWFFRYKIETATDDNVNVVYGQNEIKLHCVYCHQLRDRELMMENPLLMW